MTCYETVTIAGQTLYCNGKHKDGSRVHTVDQARLPKGFFTGDIEQQLKDQGVLSVKWTKKPQTP